jgi:hypothetical protein
VPLFDSFESIFRALSHFNSLITPPLVVVLTLGIVWRGSPLEQLLPP